MPELRRHQRAWLYLESALIDYRVSVIVLQPGPKRTRVRTTRKACLPGKGWCEAGTVIRVPTASVRW